MNEYSLSITLFILKILFHSLNGFPMVNPSFLDRAASTRFTR